MFNEHSRQSFPLRHHPKAGEVWECFSKKMTYLHLFIQMNYSKLFMNYPNEWSQTVQSCSIFAFYWQAFVGASNCLDVCALDLSFFLRMTNIIKSIKAFIFISIASWIESFIWCWSLVTANFTLYSVYIMYIWWNMYIKSDNIAYKTADSVLKNSVDWL